MAARKAFLPDSCIPTIDLILERLTSIAITIVEPGPFQCDDAGSVCDDGEDVLDGAFVFLIEFNEGAARIASVNRDEVIEVATDAAQAHTIPVVLCDDFRCDDSFSTTDRDLLGV